jgi:hypothetical protein
MHEVIEEYEGLHPQKKSAKSSFLD